ncbi:MAG TPA: ABC transporter permease [Chloroflexota bacterium]|nr:ABC transporter permease [Chloroflexota bacterium]
MLEPTPGSGGVVVTETPGTEELEFDEAGRRLRRVLLRPLTIVVLVAVLLLIVLAVLGPRLAPYDPITPDPLHEFLGPSWQHPMGTDDLGRDVLSRIMAGTRYSLLAVVIVLSLALTLGTLVGSIAGYAGGLVDEVLMRVTDIVLAFPGFILALALAAALGPSLVNGMLAIAAIWWPTYARLVRGQVLSVKENQYVEAARALGVSSRQVVRRHILPNSFAPVLVQLSLDMGAVLVTAASLSFIGLGAQLPTPEWGLMVSTDAPNILTAWWQSTFPGLAIFVTALIFNLGGDLLQEIFLRDARSAV